MRILLLSLVAFCLCLVGAAQADVLQDTCDTGMPDSIIVGSVQVPGPLWPDSIGVPVYIWADENIASLSWGLRPTDNRLKVSSFSTEGTVFDRGMFLGLKVDTVNNCLSFIWVDMTGSDPMPSPQGLIGLVYVKIAPNVSVGEQLGLDSVSVSSVYKCRLTASRGAGTTCDMRSVVFLKGSGGNFTFGQPISDADLFLAFDEGSGGIAYDRSGHRKDGVASGQPSWISGVSGNAMHFEGADDYVALPDLFNYPFYGPLTASMWIRRNLSPLADQQNILYCDSEGKWEIVVTRDTMWCSLSFDAGWSRINLPIADGQVWNHLAMVWNVSSSSLIVYLNGDSVNQVALPQSRPLVHYGNASALGAIPRLPGMRNFQGDIDEFKVWLRLLTPAEIKQEYLRVGYHRCGDIDDSREINISDVVYLISYIFGGGQAPVSPQATDIDCDGATTIADAVYLIQWIFGGGANPCASCPY
jgi:hypothetical protein